MNLVTKIPVRLPVPFLPPTAQATSLQALQFSPLSSMFNNQVCIPLEFLKKHIQSLKYLCRHFKRRQECTGHTILPALF